MDSALLKGLYSVSALLCGPAEDPNYLVALSAEGEDLSDRHFVSTTTMTKHLLEKSRKAPGRLLNHGRRVATISLSLEQ